MTRFAIVLLAFAFPLAAQTNGSQPPPPTRSAAGTFTDSQAVLGEKVFQASCASCHTVADHTDEKFRMNYFGRTVWDLWKTLKTTMPDDNIGGLPDDDYTRVVAYILKINGFAAGLDSLKSDSLELQKIKIATPAADSVKPRKR